MNQGSLIYLKMAKYKESDKRIEKKEIVFIECKTCVLSPWQHTLSALAHLRWSVVYKTLTAVFK